MQHILEYYREVKRYTALYESIEDVRGTVGSKLNSQETFGVLSYVENKWKTEESRATHC